MPKKVQTMVTDDLLVQIDDAIERYAFSSRGDILRFCIHCGLSLLASRNRQKREKTE